MSSTILAETAFLYLVTRLKTDGRLTRNQAKFISLAEVECSHNQFSPVRIQSVTDRNRIQINLGNVLYLQDCTAYHDSQFVRSARYVHPAALNCWKRNIRERVLPIAVSR